jgi:MFS family permease
MTTEQRRSTFYGWRVVSAAFILAVFGLGIGFHGPPIYLHAVREARGWSLPLVSTAVTVHFLIGALIVASLPALYRRFGIPTVTKVGAISLGLGVFGWATATSQWQLFAAALLSGAGWVTMGVAAVNAIVSPWFLRARPAALAVAYNGVNIGGVIFAPLWVTTIALLGFPTAAAIIGIVMVITVWVLASVIFTRTPEQMGLGPDGDALGTPPPSITSPTANALPGALLWRDFHFLTLAVGMALGQFAQIGTIAHLYSLLVPALGTRNAGLAMGLITAMAVVGRTCIAWLMPIDADRWLMASASYGFQIVGSAVFILAAGTSIPLLFLGVILFGLAFGNGTWLPPLIAQVEFVEDDVQRVVASIVAVSQGAFAFAPAIFGLIREFAPRVETAPGAAPHLFIVAALIQALAMAAFFAGRRR